jgi:hypoxanthine phosphoribosyltransferase
MIMQTILKNELIEIEGLQFVKYLSHEQIYAKVKHISQLISADYKHKDLVCLVVLNGAFMYACDLLRNLDIGCEIYFIKAKSYDGLKQNDIKIDIPSDIMLKGRDVLIIEDIIDSANTIFNLQKMLKLYAPKSLKLTALLSKPKMHQHQVSIDYLGFEIPDKFVIGYGLDYNHQGRNLNEIYQLKPQIAD